jgi:hypothetical protein
VEGDVLRVVAAPGEANGLAVGADLSVTDWGAPLIAGPGCEAAEDGAARCSSLAVASIEVDAGDLDDSVSVASGLPVRAFVDGGEGDDSIDVSDGVSDSVWCGKGLDTVSAETLDPLDMGCEHVDYGPPGRVGRSRPITSGGRLVAIPGQTWARVDARILADVLYLVRRYRVRITEGFGTVGHAHFGEHPLGLAVDIEPGAGGSWDDVSRLARWAEPRQNHPRFPFRWVGWNGDFNHGHPSVCKPSRGCAPHLHLSWRHSPAPPRHIARTVWAFEVR